MPAEGDAASAGARRVVSGWQAGGPVIHSKDVAEAVWLAATDPSCSRRLPAGADAVAASS